MIGLDESYTRRWKTIAKQLEELKMPDARHIAMMIADDDCKKEQLTEEECETAKFIMNFIDENDKPLDFIAIADGICSDFNEIKKVYAAMCKIGYTKEELYKFYQRNPVFFGCTLENLTKTVTYLGEIGFRVDQIKELLLKVLVIGYEEAKARCEEFLTYFDKDMVYQLGKEYLFFPYYTDPIDCLQYIISELGVEGAEKILLNEPMLLFYWKEEWQRDDPTHGFQHNEALKLIRMYARNTDS